MNDIVIAYDTLALTQQVLERQHAHARQMGSYIRAQGDIGDATGLLLSVFDPLSQAAVQAAGYAMDALASPTGEYPRTLDLRRSKIGT